jgi:hypothetical protein
MDDEALAAYDKQQQVDYENFKTESAKTVNYLVKEFEMKKSAQMHKRATVSKIGSLDMKKVYAYKLQDDLFKRITTLPQGKNHGMIMLVDWSGSMNDVLQDTLKQVINLAMFCNRVQIPYRVFAFTSDYADRERENDPAWVEKRREYLHAKQCTEDNILATSDRFHLLELFSNKMSTVEFNSMSRRLLHYKFQWNTGYNTGGTPLNEALVWIYQNIGGYIKNHGIEKMTFITLTDGEGNAVGTYGRRYLDEQRNELINGKYTRVKIKNLIKDEVTQKTYELDRQGTKQTDTILRMIKDRFGVALVGFHICGNRRGELSCALQSNLPEFKGDVYAAIDVWRKDFKDKGFASVQNTSRDELFIIPQESTKIQEGELIANSDMTSRVLARNFSKFMNVKKTSRVLLNRFVAIVA